MTDVKNLRELNFLIVPVRTLLATKPPQPLDLHVRLLRRPLRRLQLPEQVLLLRLRLLCGTHRHLNPAVDLPHQRLLASLELCHLIALLHRLRPRVSHAGLVVRDALLQAGGS